MDQMTNVSIMHNRDFWLQLSNKHFREKASQIMHLFPYLVRHQVKSTALDNVAAIINSQKLFHG